MCTDAECIAYIKFIDKLTPCSISNWSIRRITIVGILTYYFSDSNDDNGNQYMMTGNTTSSSTAVWEEKFTVALLCCNSYDNGVPDNNCHS